MSGCHSAAEVAHRDSILRQNLAARSDDELRTLNLLFDVYVDSSGHFRHNVFDAASEAEKRVKVWAEDFYGDLRLRAREHGIDAV